MCHTSTYVSDFNIQTLLLTYLKGTLLNYTHKKEEMTNVMKTRVIPGAPYEVQGDYLVFVLKSGFDYS